VLLVQRMAARRVKHTESESGKDGSAASEPVITAGINRSGKKRLNQLADFESSEIPTAESRENNLLGNCSCVGSVYSLYVEISGMCSYCLKNARPALF